jgi:ATP-binding cassette subfamily C protein
MANPGPKQILKSGLRSALTPDLRAFLRDLGTYAGRGGVVALVLFGAGAAVEGLGLALLVPLLVVVTSSSGTPGWLERTMTAMFGWFGAEAPLSKLGLVLGAYIALLIVRSIVIYLRDVRVAQLQIGFVEYQRARIVERLAATPWHRLVTLRHARITHIMSGDIQRVGTATNLLLQLSVGVTLLVAQCALLFLLAPLLAAVTLGMLVLTAFAYIPVTRRAHTIGTMVADQNLSLLNATTQFLGGLKLAISANLQGSFITEFRDTLRNLTQRQVDFQRQHTKAQLALQALSGFVGGVLVLLGFGLFQVTPATLITLLFVIIRMSGLAGAVQQAGQQFAYALPAYGMIKQLERELVEIPPEHADHGVPPALVDGPIVFDNVTFVHDVDDEDGAARGVRGLNLTIIPGEFIGVTGASGTGKTTFADLLVGLSQPQRGRISVAGIPLEGTALRAWREHMSYVTQDAFLFHDTVRRNLSWANPGASEQEMWDALALANADALVRGMEHGLDTVVGERGTRMSGGERQRLALARAMLRKPQVLILDEATSAIDIAGEHDILQRFSALAPRMTIIIVAHRSESLEFCTRVLRFERGRVEANPLPSGLPTLGASSDPSR